MSAPSLNEIRTAIAAARAVRSPRLRKVHVATARAQLTALRAGIESAEIALTDIEREIAASSDLGVE